MLRCGLVASETLLGWTVIGKVPVETIQVNPTTTLHNKLHSVDPPEIHFFRQ